MNMDMKLSVIVPVYKSEKYLNRCVDSILCQTYVDLEIILIDDGSPDTCPQICDSYEKKDARVIVLHQKNAGVSAARNAGLDTATGDYITFVDSDDYIEPDMYSSMMQVAQKYSCDVVLCDCVKESPTHKELYTHSIRPRFYDHRQLKEEYYPHLLMMENVQYPATISNCLLVFKNNAAFSKIRYIKGVRYSEDLLFGAMIMRKAESFFYMKGNAFYHYAMNPSSAAHTFDKDKWDNYCCLYQEIRNLFWNDTAFDFKQQVDFCLLFFLYNVLYEIRYTKHITQQEKKKKIKAILSNHEVMQMFHRISILRLPISWKLKVITFCYKYRINLYL